jgi:hypothetical protein
VNAKGGTKPTVSMSTREFAALNKQGAKVGVTYKLMLGGSLVGYGQPETALGMDGWVKFKVETAMAKGKTYTLNVTANDINGLVVKHTLTLKGV